MGEGQKVLGGVGGVVEKGARLLGVWIDEMNGGCGTWWCG